MYSKTKVIGILLLLVLTTSSLAAQVNVPSFRFSFAESSTEPDEARDLLNAGKDLFEKGKFTEAATRFSEILRKHARNAVADDAGFMYVVTLVKLNNRTEAVKQADLFFKNYPRSAWTGDVKELRMALTNEVPPEVLARLQTPTPQTPRPPIAPQAPPPTPARPVATTPPAPPAVVGNVPGQAPPTPVPFGIGYGRGARPGVEENPEVRLQQEALRVLFENNADRAIEIATERLKADPTDIVIISSLNMVANSRSEKALPMLVALAKGSPDPRTRKEAITWIGRSRGEKDAIADILVSLVPSMTADEDSTAIAYALRQVNTPKAYDALATMARDKGKPERLRLDAISAIGEARLSNRVTLLEEIYKGNLDNTRVRRRAVEAFTRGKEPQVVPALVTVINSDPDYSIRSNAVQYLGQLKTPEALIALENLLKKK